MNDEHKSLRDAVRSVLSKRSNVREAIDEPRGYDESLWTLLCEQIGVAALAIPEQFGGAGATLAETHIVMFELGRTLTPSPLLSSTLASQLLLAVADDDACDRLLPRIAEGTVAAVAQLDDDRAAHYVLDGDVAEILLVTHGTGVYEVDPDAATRTHTPTMDATRRLATVQLDDVPIAPIGSVDGLATALDHAAVALSAEQVGAAERILELTVEYSKTRVQFGRPIGSFQALKHRMADLHVLVESARSASFAAVDGVVAPSVAKAYCSEAFFTVAAECIQLHGGIAITWEHDAHLYFKRAHGSGQLFGSPEAHVHRLEEAIGL